MSSYEEEIENDTEVKLTARQSDEADQRLIHHILHCLSSCFSCEKIVIHSTEADVFFLFFYLGFFHEHSRIIGLQGKGEGISLSTHQHFHPLHRHLDINRTIAEGS